MRHGPAEIDLQLGGESNDKRGSCFPESCGKAEWTSCALRYGLQRNVCEQTYKQQEARFVTAFRPKGQTPVHVFR